MSVTSGFFNSTNRDRLYNATDFGRFFEGIVSDGVIKNFRDGLEVANMLTLGLQVKPGKAMFNGVWISSDDFVLLSPSAVVTPDSYGIFAVVVEVNYTTRVGSIKLVSTGDISSSTTLADGIQNVLKPLLHNDATRYSGVHQYVLAVATRNTAATTMATLVNLIGTVPASSSPYYSIRDFIAPYAAGLSYEGTVPNPFDYLLADNKPQINGVALSGNKTTEELGITATSSIFLGPATVSKSGSNVALTYSNVGTLPSGNPKKIILYGTNTSVYAFRIELVKSGTWYYPVSRTSGNETNALPGIATGVNTSFTQTGASVTISTSMYNTAELNQIFETELVW